MLSQKLNKVLCINDNEITLFILKRMLNKAMFSEEVIITSHSIDKEDSERVKKYPFVIDFLRNPMSVEYLCKLKNTLTVNYLLHNWTLRSQATEDFQ